MLLLCTKLWGNCILLFIGLLCPLPLFIPLSPIHPVDELTAKEKKKLESKKKRAAKKKQQQTVVTTNATQVTTHVLPPRVTPHTSPLMRNTSRAIPMR